MYNDADHVNWSYYIIPSSSLQLLLNTNILQTQSFFFNPESVYPPTQIDKALILH